MPTSPDRTRLSLFYPAWYLTGSGLSMLLSPEWTLRMLGSTGHYEPWFVRMSGLYVVGLAVFVVLTIRHRLTVLYPAIIGVRVFFCAAYVAFFVMTGDPFFLAVLAVVGAGLVASSVSFGLDRRAMAR